jgi:hypothetical protein
MPSLGSGTVLFSWKIKQRAVSTAGGASTLVLLLVHTLSEAIALCRS